MSDREGATYRGTLQRLSRRFGGRPGARRDIVLRRVIRLEGIAFTILDCAKCKHQVALEAHHEYGSGKPRKVTRRMYNKSGRRVDGEYRKWRTKMLRTALRCPLCKSDAFKYVRTEVYSPGQASKLYSEVDA